MSAEKLSRSIRESAGRIRGQCDEMRYALQGMRSRAMKAEEVREHSEAVMLLCGILAEINMIEGAVMGGEMSGLVERPARKTELELFRVSLGGSGDDTFKTRIEGGSDE
jgi:hypothetical protein